MEEKLVSMLRFFQKHNQKYPKTDFADLSTAYPKEEARNGLHQLQTMGFVNSKGGGIGISEAGSMKLREIDDDKAHEKSLMNNQRELIIKQKELIDTQLPIMKDQLNNYKWFKWLPIGISLLALLTSIIGLLMQIKSKT